MNNSKSIDQILTPSIVGEQFNALSIDKNNQASIQYHQNQIERILFLSILFLNNSLLLQMYINQYQLEVKVDFNLINLFDS